MLSVEVFKQKSLWNRRVLIVYLEIAVEIGLTMKILKAVSTLQKFSPYFYDKRLPQLRQQRVPHSRYLSSIIKCGVGYNIAEMQYKLILHS